MSSKKPLSVVISAVIFNNKIMLIKRERGDYIGLLALPGGKLDLTENISEGSIREIEEETGIKCEFEEYLGTVSELLYERDEIVANLVLHLCKLNSNSIEIKSSSAGVVDWYDLDSIDEIQDELIPSDYLMIKRMILNREKNYFDCIIKKYENEYFLEKFE